MEKFYKVRKGFKYSGNEEISNLDFFYGPYNSVDIAKQTLKDNNVSIGVGYTIGVIGDDDKVVEYWWQPVENNQHDFIEKIEKYELKLNYFEAYEYSNENGESGIRVDYEIGGKGLLPKVSISGTSVQSQPVNFNTRLWTFVKMSIPGKYTFSISVSDVLGTYFNNNGIDITKTVSWGDIIAKTTDVSYINNVLPQQSSYENKPFGISIEYNVDIITDIQLYLYADNQSTYQFDLPESNGKISSIFMLPAGQYYGHNNEIKVLYKKNNVSNSLQLYRFNILLPGEFGLAFPKGIPDEGYSTSTLPITVNLQYGGKPQESDVEVRAKTIQIMLDNDESTKKNFEIGVNSTLELPYTLPNIGNEDSVTRNLKIKIYDENISENKNIRILKITSPQIPVGTFYFNNSNGKTVEPQFNYNLGNFNIAIPEAGNYIKWNTEEEVSVLSIPYAHFNIDFNINCSQDGDNTPLIILTQNNKNLLTIGKQKITSDLFISASNEEFQRNDLILPQDNTNVHIGFGYQRHYGSNCYYSCIFINGEIAFCDKSMSNEDIINGGTTIKFVNSFQLYELCLSVSADSLKSCVNSAGTILDEYNLVAGTQYDVFYYNWLTTLPNGYTVPSGENLLKLQLIPFKEPSQPDEWWTELRNSLSTFGDNIKEKDSEKQFTTFQFVTFGNVNHGTKEGIVNSRKLFEFEKQDKESRKLDKLCGAICKYKFINGNEVISYDNKYCIVQVQGTSTLAYPVPNFQFTFIEYVQGQGFRLDDSIQLEYLHPNFTQINGNDDQLSFTSMDPIENETNLVAKADSMDSSHLNNTPTCIYFNSLVNSLASNGFDGLNNGNVFNKFDPEYLDAIVGTPMLLEIDSNEQNNVDRNIDINTVNQFNSYGTFMFNTGKSAKCMGLQDTNNPVFSLEGQSNEESDIVGAGGLFTLPTVDIDKINTAYPRESQAAKQQILETNTRIVEAFDKLRLNIDNNGVTVTELSTLDNSEKKTIIDYLINDTSFESRSTISDKNIVKTENWNNYALPIIRMWLFVNKSTDEEFAQHFSEVFNLEYAILYYINLLLFGQADNLGKNMMLDAKYDEQNIQKEIWYVRPYDLDSENGLTNNGYDNFPTYGCISREHFQERFIDTTYADIMELPDNTFTMYNSKSSKLWQKFWKSFKTQIQTYYANLRNNYITPGRLIDLSKTLVNDKISKEQYNIDFSLKHLGTKFSYLNKGGRFLNYEDWITKRFMYVDSYFSYFKVREDLPNSYNGYEFKVGKTLIPIFYEANYQSAKTRYGFKDWTYGVLTGNLQFVFNIVPEAVLYMSPIWGNLVSKFNQGLFKNLQKYSGAFNLQIFSNSELFNLREIEIIQPEQYTISSQLTVPKSVRVLRLENIKTSDGFNGSFLNIQSDGGLEELYIHNCDVSELNIYGLSKLKVLKISSYSSNQNNHTEIGTLSLSHLNLSKLEIETYTKINSLIFNGQITQDDVIDLSGIDCKSLSFGGNPTVRELYLDQLYNFNGETCSVYQFGENKKFRPRTNHSTYTDNSNRVASNIEKRNDDTELYETVYFNKSNCRRISPSTSDSQYDTLDLTNCTNLEKFSCIGYEKLQQLNIPTTVEYLNLQYCKNLKRLNSNTDILNFNGFRNLQCNKNYEILKLNSHTNPSYLYYTISNINTESFNLLGCDSAIRIANLNNNSVSSSFTGDYFVAGCRNLKGFDSCSLTFTNLNRSFRMTEKLESLPNSFTFNLTGNNVSANSAFSDTGISISSVLIMLKDKEIDATNIFSGQRITENITDIEDGINIPIELNWTNCATAFSYPRYKSTSINPVNGIYDYEGMCISSQEYANDFPDTDTDDPKFVNIKINRASSVLRMFMSQNIYIDNPNTIFQNNTTNLKSAQGFLANTKQNTLIDFTYCTKLTNVRYCYAYSGINKQSLLDNSQLITNCKLPSSVTDVCGLFRRTNLSELDVNGIFSGLSKITNAIGCFIDTKCDCSGNPFNENTTGSLNISALFGSSKNYRHQGTISDLSWVSDRMTTGSEGPSNYNSDTTTELFGVFEGKIIDNFQTVAGVNTSQRRMFKDSIISSYKNDIREFTIIGTNSSRIFEAANLSASTQDQLTIRINQNVQNLSRAFMYGRGIAIKIDLNTNNSIRDLSYFLCRTIGSVSLLDDQYDGYLFFPALTNASNMFDQAITYNEERQGAIVDSSLTVSFPDYLFKNSPSLSNINYICRYLSQNKIFDFTGCTSISTMNYAFAGSGIQDLPSFSRNLNFLTSMKGAFRKITLNDQSTEQFIIENAKSLSDANEVFAQSVSQRSEGTMINISGCISLKNINAFSTSTSIKLSLNDSYNKISALLPNTSNTVAGDLIITGISDIAEGANTIIYTENNSLNIKWNNNITTCRNRDSKTDAFYTLAVNEYKYLADTTREGEEG